MNHPGSDTAFVGSIPELYERYLVPLIFEPYAADLALRIARRQPTRLLEIAAGTGVVTRQLAKTLPPEVSIVATDLNQAMLDQAAAKGTSRPVEWRQADALQLPFPDEFFSWWYASSGSCSSPTKHGPSPKRGGCFVPVAGSSSTCGTGSSTTTSPTR